MKLFTFENPTNSTALNLKFAVGFDGGYSFLGKFRNASYFFSHIRKMDIERWRRGKFREKEKFSYHLTIAKLIFIENPAKAFLTHSDPLVRHIARAFISKDFDWIEILFSLVNISTKKRWSKEFVKNLEKRPEKHFKSSLRLYHV